MADIREQLLARLLHVVKVRGVSTALRNQTVIPDDDQLPAVILLDGNEQGNDADPMSRPANAPRRIAMLPQIRLLVQGASEQVGSDINILRARIVKAVQTDAILLTLSADNRAVRYEGCATQFSAARATMADMMLGFRIDYHLRIPDL